MQEAVLAATVAAILSASCGCELLTGECRLMQVPARLITHCVLSTCLVVCCQVVSSSTTTMATVTGSAGTETSTTRRQGVSVDLAYSCQDLEDLLY